MWGTVLDVPQRSQMIYPGGNVWCSPTSVTMVMGYWGQKLGDPGLPETVPTAAGHIHDWIYGGTGNWPFNTAYAAARSNGKLHGFVTRLKSISQLEPLLKAGIPVVVGIGYGGSIAPPAGAPLPSVDGHLFVVRGIDANGDVVVNDPAFNSDAQVKVTYTRADFMRIWHVSDGVAYVIYPADMTLPVTRSARTRVVNRRATGTGLGNAAPPPGARPVASPAPRRPLKVEHLPRAPCPCDRGDAPRAGRRPGRSAFSRGPKDPAAAGQLLAHTPRRARNRPAPACPCLARGRECLEPQSRERSEQLLATPHTLTFMSDDS